MRADRDLLILDEPSSGLDAEAEHAIQRELAAPGRPDQRADLAPAQLGSRRRTSSYVLSGGRVAEQGTHEELMAAGGEYRRLFMLQASGYQARSDQQVTAR